MSYFLKTLLVFLKSLTELGCNKNCNILNFPFFICSKFYYHMCYFNLLFIIIQNLSNLTQMQTDDNLHNRKHSIFSLIILVNYYLLFLYWYTRKLMLFKKPVTCLGITNFTLKTRVTAMNKTFSKLTSKKLNTNILVIVWKGFLAIKNLHCYFLILALPVIVCFLFSLDYTVAK